MNRFASTRMFSPAKTSPYGRPLRMGAPSRLACPYVATEEDVEGLGCATCQEEEEELGCATCKRVRKRMRSVAAMSGRHLHLGQTCSINPAPTGLNCQLTSTGDIICSDGQLYAKDCPNAPVVNYAGVAQDVDGVPTPPPAPAGGSGATGTFLDTVPTWGLVAGGLGAAAILYAVLKK